ncbi:MFS transporter [Pseudomonas alcaligenes]|uniref:MFS transporter n=1 Tax=Aquipseudomonas alcaligenes TaxID=43263 RepID=A0ABR7S4E0_AQUAC|nr:MFS transporter [Pseudomonas alcaligenes]MBC9252338.1 MFS transporter [Pseudomonas alcaligenes]
MTRTEVRRRLALEWWRWLGFALAPLFCLNLLFGKVQPVLQMLELPLFVAGLGSLFVTLPLFSAYKRALIATEKALDSADEPAAWIELARRRRLAFLAAALPAWVAVPGLFTGLHAVALVLLALSSVVLFSLYRIPRQLG